VDLNRNWPGDLHPFVLNTAALASGPYPYSEPETVAMQHLVDVIDAFRPLSWAVSYHQPLLTVDCDPQRGAALLAACDRFATATGIPRDPFIKIPGTLTDTMNAQGKGLWFTVEFDLGTPSPAEIARHVAAVTNLGA
jgi:hypothetical protein